ncbi:histidine kinase [archaeon SCG-AAA382B04]|nr:histidine kinase [archaeon SCG-AAA382B04]
MKVSDVMSREILTINKEARIRDTLDRMNEEGVGSLLVEDQGKMIGIVTTYDILKLIGSEEFGDDVLVEDVMTPRLLVIDQDLDVEEAAKKLADANIWRLPVVEKNEDKKEIVGILSARDILRNY